MSRYKIVIDFCESKCDITKQTEYLIPVVLNILFVYKIYIIIARIKFSCDILFIADFWAFKEFEHTVRWVPRLFSFFMSIDKINIK